MSNTHHHRVTGLCLLLLFAGVFSAPLAVADEARLTDVQGSLSGSWYDPNRDGEGFVFEFGKTASSTIATVYWFTHKDGQPFWLIGAREYDPELFDEVGLLEFDLLEVSGTGFGTEFVPDDIAQTPKGSIGFVFEDCDRVLATYSPPQNDAGLGTESIEYQLERITLGLTGVPCQEKQTVPQCNDPALIQSYRLQQKNANVYEFVDKEQSPEFEYAGQVSKPGPMQYFTQGSIVYDLWEDGHDDVFVPLMRGYAAPVDNRTKPLMFKNENGVFVERGADLEDIPKLPGVRRVAKLEGPNDPFNGLFMVQHGGDFMDGDSMLLAAGDIPSNVSDMMEPFPKYKYLEDANPTLVNAHSMGGGDINGNGRTDFVVGDWGNFWGEPTPTKPFFLVQKSDGSGWRVEESDFLDDVMNNQPMVNPDAGDGNLLIDLHLADFNGDGLDDLVAGWGHGSTHSYVFFNQGDGRFSRSDAQQLPDPPYGIDNSLHLKTFSLDISGNGANDLVIIYSRDTPYYKGYAFQILINDGNGQFEDETDARMSTLDAFADPDDYESWSDEFSFLDINGDGHVDLIGSQGWPDAAIRVWLNDGNGVFIEKSVNDDLLGQGVWNTVGWVAQQNGDIDTLVFQKTDLPGETAEFYTRISFSHYSLVPETADCDADK